MSVEIYDRSSTFFEMYEKARKRGLRRIGVAAEGYAKKATPVITGRLRNSITYVTSDHAGKTIRYDSKSGEEAKENVSILDETFVYIGTNVDYARYVENGARGKTARHMLKNAATGHSEEYERLMKDSLEHM